MQKIIPLKNILKVKNGAITNNELAVKNKYYAIPVPIILVQNYQVEK